MTREDWIDIAKSMGQATKEYVESVVAPLLTRIDQLESAKAIDRERIKALEAREYQGVWGVDKAYEKGASVTYQGSLWIARVASQGRAPGTDGNSPWQLAVKKGRDGKDAHAQ